LIIFVNNFPLVKPFNPHKKSAPSGQREKKDFQDSPRSERTDNRSKTGMVIGFRALIEAINAGKEVDKVLVQKGLQGELFHEARKVLAENNIPFQQVPAEKLNGISRANHQGIIAFLSPIAFGNIENIVAEVFEAGQTHKILLLDGITDVRNFGAICRSAECQGFHAVIIPEKGSAQVNEDALKTSAGALFHLPVCKVKSLKSTAEWLIQSGIKIVACSEKGRDSISEIDLKGPICLVMGSEETGISSEIIRSADNLAQIPMFGQTSSLNVSVAAGIMMYELNRQRIILAT
jgi:23S rRNA (guanosine2251-2'-O)-methyltransferase